MKIDTVTFGATTSGKPYKKIQAEGKKFNVWSDDPMYALFEAGADLDIQIISDPKNPKYFKYQRSGDETGVVIKSSGGPMDYQDKTRRNVEDAQSSKELGIKTSSTIRDAVLIVVERMKREPFPTEQDVKDDIKRWRTWLWNNWNYEDFNNENKPPEDWQF